MTSKELDERKQKRAKAELERLYPGLTNAEITAIQRERLSAAEATSIETSMRKPGYKKYVSTLGRAKLLGESHDPS